MPIRQQRSGMAFRDVPVRLDLVLPPVRVDSGQMRMLSPFV